MNIKKVLEEKLREEEKELKERQKSADERIALARQQLEDLKKRTDLPEKTDTLEKLKKSSGRSVEIVDGYSTKIETYQFKDGRIETSIMSYPVIGSSNNGIKRITDKQSGEVIFENPYYNESVALQYAMLLGKEAGLKEAELEIDYAIESKKYLEDSFNETKEAYNKVPMWISKGEKMIFPQRAQKWQECVIARATGLYKGKELENALEIMETLDKGGSVKDAKKLLEAANHSGMSYSITMSIVGNFSKRGPEFYRKVEKTNPEWLQNIERENKSFERELSGGGKN